MLNRMLSYYNYKFERKLCWPKRNSVEKGTVRVGRKVKGIFWMKIVTSGKNKYILNYLLYKIKKIYGFDLNLKW